MCWHYQHRDGRHRSQNPVIGSVQTVRLSSYSFVFCGRRRCKISWFSLKPLSKYSLKSRRERLFPVNFRPQVANDVISGTIGPDWTLGGCGVSVKFADSSQIVLEFAHRHKMTMVNTALSSEDLQKNNVAFARWRHSQPDRLYSRTTAIQVQHQPSQELNISGSRYQQCPWIGQERPGSSRPVWSDDWRQICST